MLAQTQRSLEATPVGRIIKQREPQIVYIKATDSDVFVNLPSLVPNFQNVSSGNNQNSHDFFYQVKSFRCKNRFYNLKRGDSIQLRVLIEWYSYGMIQSAAGDYELPINIVLNDTSEDKIVTAFELTDILNNEIKRIQAAKWIDTTPRTVGYCDFVNLFQCAQFVFDQAYGKMALEINPSSGFKKTFKYVTTATTDYIDDEARMYRAVVYFLIPTDILPGEQARLAKMFGITTYLQQDDSYIVNEETSVNNGIQLSYIFDTKLQLQPLVSKQLSIEEEDQVGNDYTQFRLFDSLYLRLYAPAVMNMFRYDKIFIRSSLATNMWNQDGRRQNVICVVPVEGAITGQAIEYCPAGSHQRTYNIKDSLSSIQNFQVMLTDEYDEKIEFVEDFELVIAVFFTPSDPTLAAM